jgi:hypothetical protein
MNQASGAKAVTIRAPRTKAARQRWRSVLARLVGLGRAPDEQGVDAAIVGAQDLEAQPGDVDRFIELRQAPEVVQDQAADGGIPRR